MTTNGDTQSFTSRRCPTCYVGALLFWTVLGTQPTHGVADVLILKDGRTFEGTLQKSNDKTVTFEIVRPAGKIVMNFDKDEVLQVTQGPIRQVTSQPGNPATQPSGAQAASAPSAVATRPTKPNAALVVYIHGTFGLEVNNEYLLKCMNRARLGGYGTVIFDVDSPGGLVADLEDMLATIDKFKDLHSIAYVRKAGSAAAILSLGCKQIVMHPQGVIGAAVVYSIKPGMDNLPPSVVAKFESYNVAKFKAVAESGGHDPLFVEGMMRLPLELSLVEGRGQPKVVEGNVGRVIKRRGEILTLTAKEAVAGGLAAGMADGVEDCGKVLNRPELTLSESESKGLRSQWVKELESVIRECAVAENLANDYATELTRRGRSQKGTQLLKDIEGKLRIEAGFALKYPALALFGYIREYDAIMQMIDDVKTARVRLEAAH